MGAWFHGFLQAVLPPNIYFLILGTLVGMVVGVLPGLGPLFGVALMMPLTFGMPAATALIFLAAIHATTAYGDSIASILLNTPGGGGSIAVCWDGHPLARQGKAGLALNLSTISSFTGGLLGWLSMVVISPILVAFALRVGPPEIFMITVLALTLLSVAIRGATIKGLVMACVGLMLAFTGQDPITGTYRFTFGIAYLEDGVGIIPVVLGVFAISQIFIMAEEGGTIARARAVSGGAREAFREFLKRPLTIIRGGLVGIWMGVLPALGISSANVMAYLVEKQASKDPDSFGKGNPSGVIAPEVAKSSCIVGDLIPTFTLGIPGSSTTAILMAALIIHGIRPGPEFFTGDLPFIVFAGILLAQFCFFITGLLTAKHWAKIVVVPNSLLVPLIGVLTVLGAFFEKNRIEGAVVAVIFGLIGYVMKKNDYPPAALVLGLVLGDMAESNFNRSMMIFENRLSWIYLRPICLGLLACIVLSFSWPYVSAGLRQLYTRVTGRTLVRMSGQDCGGKDEGA